jgi:hypothetical protein
MPTVSVPHGWWSQFGAIAAFVLAWFNACRHMRLAHASASLQVRSFEERAWLVWRALAHAAPLSLFAMMLLGIIVVLPLIVHADIVEYLVQFRAIIVGDHCKGVLTALVTMLSLRHATCCTM